MSRLLDWITLQYQEYSQFSGIHGTGLIRLPSPRTMKLTITLIALSTFANLHGLLAQTSEPDQTPAATSGTSAAPAPAERPVSWKLLVPNLLSDQERMWTFPSRLAQGRNWLPTAAVLGTAAALLIADPAEARYFRGNPSFHQFNNLFSGSTTSIGMVVAPVSLYAAGFVRKDAKMQHTALFAGEVVADAEILTTVLKDVTNRVRPAAVPTRGNFSDTWFEGGSILQGRGSFPSGHTIAAFSIATVIARRYRNHRWVPYVAYGGAALVGFSRLSLSAHFLSDVFVGGALGYSITRFAVLQQ